MSRPSRMKADLVLLHPPSVLDFRERPTLRGPVSDLVPSSAIFEMYPIGFSTLAAHLEENGFRARIANIAARMMADPKFDPAKFVKGINSAAIGIDLHWLPHADGALSLARICKEQCPETPVIFGGLSSTYYSDEIMREYPDVDYVLKGDSTEEPLLALLEALAARGGPEKETLAKIPNLSWRDGKACRSNPITNVPQSLDHLTLDYSAVMRSALRSGSMRDVMPAAGWKDYPVTAALTVRGCTHNCITCGGSAFAYKKIFCREKPAYRSPRLLARDIANIAEFSRGPIYILGDIRQAGARRAGEFLDALGKEKLQNEIVFEFFTPAREEFVQEAARAAPQFSVSISPESHDERVRALQGRGYSTDALEATVEKGIAAGAGRFDVFFMLGLSWQDYNNAVEAADYGARLLQKHGKSGRLGVFVSPLAPFVDPGSIAFENAPSGGYSVAGKSLRHHRQLLRELSWSRTLNYSTEWMRGQEIAEATYECALRLVDAKEKAGIIPEDGAKTLRERIALSKSLVRKLDIMRDAHEEPDSATEAQIQAASGEVLCRRSELWWKSGGLRYRPLKMAGMLLKPAKRK